MTEDSIKELDNIEIQLIESHHETDHVCIDLADDARLHVSVSSYQHCVTMHDGENQAAIVVNEEGDMSHVSHDCSIGAVERKDSPVSALSYHNE